MVSQISKRSYTPASGGSPINAEEVVRRLRARIEEMGKTQVEFAEFVGISTGMLSLILSEKRAPNIKVLRCLGLCRVDRVEYFESAGNK